MGEPITLTKVQHAALREISVNPPGRLYWWRRASMAVLAGHGLVETWRPKSLEHSKWKTLPYRITDAGRAFLAQSDPSPRREGR